VALPAFELSHIASCLPLEGLRREESQRPLPPVPHGQWYSAAQLAYAGPLTRQVNVTNRPLDVSLVIRGLGIINQTEVRDRPLPSLPSPGGLVSGRRRQGQVHFWWGEIAQL
jgi:hypothetical protein